LAEREQLVRIIALIGESKIARPVLVNILYFRKLWTELGKPPIKWQCILEDILWFFD